MADSRDLITEALRSMRTVKIRCQFPENDSVYQRALTGTGDTGNAGKESDRDLYIDLLEVILSCPVDTQISSIRRQASLS